MPLLDAPTGGPGNRGRVTRGPTPGGGSRRGFGLVVDLGVAAAGDVDVEGGQAGAALEREERRAA